MGVAGIIVEYNPLHNGHIEHLEDTKRLTGCNRIVAVMSGNFVQRGEPAICDKWRRTRMALMAGVDVVIELPLGYVLSGADYFARGAVGILDACGIVNTICFGSESGNMDAIRQAAEILAREPAEFREILKDGLSKGLSYAAAKGAALEGTFKGLSLPEGLLTRPNDGLGIEYVKAMLLLDSKMGVFTSHRIVKTTASGVRKAVLKEEDFSEDMPEYAYEILNEGARNEGLASPDGLSDIFRYLLFTLPPDRIVLGEGLENRFRRFAGEYGSMKEIIDAVKTKRYTRTRLQRAAMRIILGLENKPAEPAYIRVLGFRKNAHDLVGEMTRKTSLPVITNLHKGTMSELSAEGQAMLTKELEAGAVYKLALGFPNRHMRKSPKINHEWSNPLIII